MSGTVPGATVTLDADGNPIGSAVASGTTTTIFTNGTSLLADGTHQFAAFQVEPGKLASAISPALGVVVDTTPPAAAIVAVTPNPRTSSVDQITIQFSEPISGLDLSDLDFSLNGGPNLLTGAQSVSSNNGTTWTLSNLSPITSAAGGLYELDLNPIGTPIIDTAGNQDTTEVSTTFTIDLASPAVDLNGAADGINFAATWTNSGPASIADLANATVSDADSADLASLVVALSNPQTGDTLAANMSGTSITASYSNGVLSLTGSDTAADYQQVLRTITYDNTNGGPGINPVVATFVASDGLLTSAAAASTITIDVAPPAVDLNGAASGVNFATTWTNSGPVSIADPANAALSDADSADLASLVVMLSNPQIGDTLAANTSGTSITASFSGGVLSLTGVDTVADYQQVLRTITYDNTNGGPGINPVTISVVASDGLLASVAATTTITTDVSPPVVDLNGGVSGINFTTANWNHAGAVNIADSANATVTDSDSTLLSSLTATIVSPAAGDTLTASTAGTSITASFSGGVLTLSGSDTPADYQQVLRSIQYNNTSASTPSGTRTINIVATDSGSLTSTPAAVSTVNLVSTIGARDLFYNNSKFDKNTPGIAGTTDDAAIAPDKSALLPGAPTATSANVSSYSKGINGIMVNLQGAGNHGSITLANILNDFTFKVGNNNTPSTWATATSPISVSVRAGAGVGGSDRVELIWADNAIKETWLEVIVKANTDTGLAQQAGEPTGVGDVFFFGDAAADDFSGETTIAFTNATDDLDARSHAGVATITNIYDYNKDGFVNSTDSLAARVSGSIRFIKIANPPAAPDADPSASPAVTTAAVPSSSTSADSGIASALDGLGDNERVERPDSGLDLQPVEQHQPEHRHRRHDHRRPGQSRRRQRPGGQARQDRPGRRRQSRRCPASRRQSARFGPGRPRFGIVRLGIVTARDNSKTARDLPSRFFCAVAIRSRRSTGRGPFGLHAALEANEVDRGAGVSATADSLHAIVRFDGEGHESVVDRRHPRRGDHRAADGRGGQVFHVHFEANRDPAWGEQRLNRVAGSHLHQVDHERRAEHLGHFRMKMRDGDIARHNRRLRRREAGSDLFIWIHDSPGKPLFRRKLRQSGGHGTRTRNRFPGTTFPVSPLAIRLPSGDQRHFSKLSAQFSFDQVAAFAGVYAAIGD